MERAQRKEQESNAEACSMVSVVEAKRYGKAFLRKKIDGEKTSVEKSPESLKQKLPAISNVLSAGAGSVTLKKMAGTETMAPSHKALKLARRRDFDFKSNELTEF